MPKPSLSPTDVRQRRDALGLTQAELAAALGVSVTTVARWEMAGEARRPAPYLALALDALACQRNETDS